MRLRLRLPVFFYYILALAVVLLAAGYVHTNQLPYPRFDQWFHSIRVAENTVDGTLTYHDIVRPNYGHRIVFPALTTALVAWLTNWNLAVEVWIGFGALVVAFMFVIQTVRRAAPAVFPPFVLLAAILMFSLRHHTNLVWSFNALQWFYMSAGMAAATYALFALPVGWRAILMLIAATVFSGYSSGGGLILIPLVTVFLWFRGYRKPLHYGTWFTGAMLILFFYFRNMEQNVRRVSPESLNFHFEENITYIITMLTGQFVPFPRETTPVVFVVIFAAALGLGIWNIWWLWRNMANRTLVTLVMFLAGIGVGASVLTSLGRSVTLWWGAQSRLFTMSVYAWLALALSALVIWHETRRRRGVLAYANAALLVFIVGGQAYVNVVQLTHDEVEGYVGHLEPEDVRCYWGYLISRSASCIMTLDPLNVTEGEIDGLFERRLAHFRIYDGANPVQAVMPDVYRRGEPVIVSGPLPQQQAADVAYRDLDADEIVPVPAGNLARLMEPSDDASPVLAASAAAVVRGTDAVALGGLVQTADRVWHLRAEQPEDYDAVLVEMLAADFDRIPMEGVHWRTTVYDDVTLWLRRPEPLLQFGERVQLVAWELLTPMAVAPCETIQTRMLWHSDGDLPANYSLALVLAGPDGVGQLRADAAPGGLTTSQWEADTFYRTTDGLNIPCDFPAGDYPLLTGLYVPGTGEGLPVSDAGGSPQGELAYLTTITVR